MGPSSRSEIIPLLLKLIIIPTHWTITSTESSTISESYTPTALLSPNTSSPTSTQQVTTTGIPSTLFTQCYNPIAGTDYSSHGSLCIYGIRFRKGFDMDLICNDDSMITTQTVEALNDAGKRLCDYVYKTKKYAYDAFQEIYIKNDNGRYEDLFITCCQNCNRSTQEWRILLKAQFLIHRYALIRGYDKKQGYVGTKRASKIHKPQTCFTDNYREVPVTGNNNVGFVYRREYHVNVSVNDRARSKLRAILTMGQYNATTTGYYKGLTCQTNFISTEKSSQCNIKLVGTHYEYLCCCYGSEIGICQEKISNAITNIDRSVRKILACVPPLELAMNHSLSYSDQNDSIVISGSVNNIVKVLRQAMGLAKCNMFIDSQFSLLYESDASEKCELYNNWDFRLQHITIVRCFEETESQCPIGGKELSVDKLLCCCNHQPFCNYNKNLRAKIFPNATKSAAQQGGASHNVITNDKLPNCSYNRMQQYLFNEHYLNIQPNEEACLVHFMSADLLNEVGIGTATNMRFGSYPGNGFYPIDFTYAFLKDDQCLPIDVELNEAFFSKKVNCGSAYHALDSFQTKFMPLKLTACRCNPSLNPQCDNSSKILNESMNVNVAKCLQYNRTEFKDLKDEDFTILSPQHTSYCFTEVIIQDDEKKGFLRSARGNVVTRHIAKLAEKFLDHIAYSMYSLTGARTQMCAYRHNRDGKRTGTCFCRTYGNKSDACNADPWLEVIATKLILSERYIRRTRLEYENVIARVIGKTVEWCHVPYYYAVMDVDYDNKSVDINPKCAYEQFPERQESEDEQVFCSALPESLLVQGCLMIVPDDGVPENNRLICCCITEDFKCSAIGAFTDRMIKHIKKGFHE